MTGPNTLETTVAITTRGVGATDQWEKIEQTLTVDGYSAYKECSNQYV